MRQHSLALCFVALLTGTCLQQPSVGQETEPAKSQKETPAESKEAHLGIGVVPMHPTLAIQLSSVIGKDRGVVVANVAMDSPAAAAGIQVHDLIVTYDKQDVYSTEQLVKLVRNDKPGREVMVEFIRDAKLMEVAVKLDAVAVRHKTMRWPISEIPVPELPGRRQWVGMVPPLLDSANWDHFESLNISKDEDGNYKAKIVYRDDEKTLDKSFEGTREEIEEAIKNDEEIPASAKDHLQRALDMKVRVQEFFERGPNLDTNGWPLEHFQWPNKDF